jgi:hypothetical protein
MLESGPRYWAGECAKCGELVWLTPGGACGKGHSTEFISDVEEVEAPTRPLRELMHCRTCGAELYGEIPACGGCGFPPRAGTSFCPGCGTPTQSGQVMCIECGAALGDATTASAAPGPRPHRESAVVSDSEHSADPVGIRYAEEKFFASPGRESSSAFDSTDVAWTLKRTYDYWTEERTDKSWWEFYKVLLDYATYWPHGGTTVRVVSECFPEAVPDSRVRAVLVHLGGRGKSVPAARSRDVTGSGPARNQMRSGAQTVPKPGTGSGAPASTPEGRTGWVIGGVVGLVLLVAVAIGATKDECVRRRQAIGGISYYSEMLGGASANSVQSGLMDRVRCPLGSNYSSDGSCPIHGALSIEEKMQVYRNTRGVYGY